MSPVAVIAAILALNGVVLVHTQKVPGVPDALEKQICGIASHFSDLFEMTMTRALTKEPLKRFFGEEYVKDFVPVTAENFYQYIKNLMYEIYRQTSANVDKKLGTKVFDQTLSKWLLRVDAELEELEENFGKLQ